MNKNTWFTLVWKDNARTIPSTRGVWLLNEHLLSIRYEDGLYTAFVSSGTIWGPVVLEGCTSWAEAQVAAMEGFRSELVSRILSIKADIEFLDKNIEGSERNSGTEPGGKVEQALREQNLYLMRYGRPSEEDHSLNDSNRKMILAMKETYGQVYVGSFNGEPDLVPYEGGQIYNSAYDFCVPEYDEQLDSMIRQWKDQGEVRYLNGAHKQIQALNGHLLLWV